MTGDQPLELPISQFDYHLPPELIAQRPVEPRDSSRLLIVDRQRERLEDRVFHELPDILDSGDLLVLNNTRVIPARLFARRRTGGLLELLMLARVEGNTWHALARPSRRLRAGELLAVVSSDGVSTDVEARVIDRQLDGSVHLSIDEADAVLREHGQMPLPPYIAERLDDSGRYQTVYAQHEGSAAAPTAGLHFTVELLERCMEAGIGVEFVTLHVGLDTFQPVKVENALQHQIHSEWYDVHEPAVEALAACRKRGNRIIAVGTTVARTLETIGPDPFEGARQGSTSIYITPPYEFRLVDAMVTNFHLPRTTLLLMVSALAGQHLIKRAYEHAIHERYRFYSFGDAMLIV